MQLDLTYRETWLHRVNPSVKLLLFLVLFGGVLFVHRIDFLINFTWVTMILLLGFSGHPLRRVCLFSIPFLLIFVSTASSMILFGKGQTIWFQWGLVSISEESFYRGLHLGFRALNFAALGLLFSLTTRPVSLFYSLMQQLKLPPKYAYSFMAGIRLVPMMLEELQTLRLALKVRGMQQQKGVRGFLRRLKAYAVPLLAQSIRRAQRIAVAMEAKRFSLTGKRTYYYKFGVAWQDLALLVYFVVTLYAAFWLSIHFPYFGIADVRDFGRAG